MIGKFNPLSRSKFRIILVKKILSLYFYGHGQGQRRGASRMVIQFLNLKLISQHDVVSLYLKNQSSRHSLRIVTFVQREVGNLLNMSLESILRRLNAQVGQHHALQPPHRKILYATHQSSTLGNVQSLGSGLFNFKIWMNTGSRSMKMMSSKRVCTLLGHSYWVSTLSSQVSGSLTIYHQLQHQLNLNPASIQSKTLLSRHQQGILLRLTGEAVSMTTY